MTSIPGKPRESLNTVVDWLLRVNGQVSQWAATTSWPRLIALFVVILIAGNVVSDRLRLRHDRERVDAGLTEAVVVSIGGPNGIRIEGQAPSKTAPSRPALPGASQPTTGAPAAIQPAASQPASGAPDAPQPAVAGDAASGNETVRAAAKPAWRNVITIRGILGDLGVAVVTVLFAYLLAAKVIVRKTAESEAKVRDAISAAEREAMERQLVQARLKILQAQVEPHFLFNTLAAVDYLIETDSKRASVMQKALIHYLRGALPQMREESSTLGRELALTRSYLDLLKMRIEDRLEIAIQVPQELESAVFPPMMLQSLVENAIKHGIEPKPEGGKVTVSARVLNGQLRVEVHDTGVGLTDGELLEGPTSGTGLGLDNIRERLGMLYPGKSGLMLRSDDFMGTLVRITVPYQARAALAEPNPTPPGPAGQSA